MATGLAVRLRAVVALLGGFPALAGADLDVGAGEVVLLEGANGAGKTTILRVCAGLTPVAAGEVTVLGHDLVADRRAVRRHVGLLGHSTFLYDDLTVRENVTFAVRASACSPSAVAPALQRCGLERVNLPASKLSAGQRRRAALAILLARRPSLWLLDEPHAGLDADGRDLVDECIREAASEGRAVVMASHERDRATPIADRVLTVAGGTIASEVAYVG